MDVFEQTFEKHRLLMLERLEGSFKLNAEQNSALNRLFVVVRDCLRDIKNEVPVKHFDELSKHYKSKLVRVQHMLHLWNFNIN